jgi:hypothetical protein
MKGLSTLLTTTVISFFVLVFVGDAAGQLVISEFRVRGPNGANDEFIEIYNNSGANHTVAGGGTGYAVAASNGVARCVIPNGTVIPNRGHYLCVNSVGYSLASYPAGNGTTATADATYTTDIPDNAGIAIFNTSVAANFTLANRLDAIGSTSEANTTYKEGTGYPALTPFSIDYSFYRDDCGKSGSITTFGHCAGGVKDTNNNAADLIFVDTNGTSAGAGQRLGSPGPQNLSSAVPGIPTASNVLVSPLDTCVSRFSPPNAVRDFTSDPANNSTFGTLDFRFKVTNLTGGNMTRLRFRIVDLTTFPAPSGIADLRPRTSTAVVVTTDNAPCGSGTTNVTVQGTTLEQPPSQPNGGGFNSSMSAGTVTLATPVANNASLNLRILLGIQQNGSFKLGLLIETLPGGGRMHYLEGVTLPTIAGFPDAVPFEFGTDSKSDMSIFRPSTGQWWHRRSNDGVFTAASFGISTDRTVPADYTGDDITDRAVFRPSNGTWYVLRSDNGTTFTVPFGVSTDIPAPADYDGDGYADMAVYRPSTGVWYIRSTLSGAVSAVQWGNSSDLPVPADYDGDSRADLAIWRASVGQWWINFSNGGNTAFAFGAPGDKTVVGDYTGDQRADVAFWRPSTGTWYVLRSQDYSYFGAAFGVSSDLPVPGDYDGDRITDIGVFRPSTGTWYVINSGGGPLSIINFGLSTDQALPNTYVR